ncbi:acyltransferase family protein [Methylobacterium sp. NEAU K]|uniref:acyltransferase family protein n=1 Tax=Methylobacterium sp. NEAU K TaxID=3064946 RepID=UPI002734F3E3|nr:acyltransferase family protein [Methylobacterium sp. NEAU K]MDP4006103.1 acyltransferase family protein [Methylobacterium sp. NEAU K]
MPSSRAKHFGSLRLLLASLVVVSHSEEAVYGNNSGKILMRIFGTRSFGHFAVDGFFLASGHLITKSFQNSRSTVDYVAKRPLRIYFAFIVAFIVDILIIVPCSGGYLRRISFFKSVKNLLFIERSMMPNAFPG